ncbi:MAG: TolC family protein [Planctomycetota bacterium]|nr:TolC family protein [Planctomycetota bacterium]
MRLMWVLRLLLVVMPCGSAALAVEADVIEPAEVGQLSVADRGTPIPSVSEDVPPLQVNLTEALRLAFTEGRSKKTSDEDLTLVAHRLRVVRRDYGPRLSGTIDGDLSADEAESPDAEIGASVTVSQELPTAGRVSVTGSTRRLEPADGDGSYNQNLEVVLTQPLLRDAGQLVWREGLTDAERAYLYAERGHVQFLQDLSLDVADSFWRLQVQQYRVESSRDDVKRNEFGLDQAKAFLGLGRTTANDVFRAEVSLLQAQQSLVDAIAAYDASLDRFKIDLNLPVDAPVDITGDAPQRPLLDVDSRLAIQIALDNRLDLMTSKDRIGDAQRNVALARNNILPDLDLDARASWGENTQRPWDDVIDDRPDYIVGLTLEIPFERYRERFGYAERMTDLSQARRSSDLKESQVVREVQAALRDLRIAEVSLKIQERNIEQSRKRLIKSQMDFEDGLISNRDLVEAQGEVRDAEVAFFQARINYTAAELRLRRETGVLVVDAAGMWRTTLPSYIKVRDGEQGAMGDDGAK